MQRDNIKIGDSRLTKNLLCSRSTGNGEREDYEFTLLIRKVIVTVYAASLGNAHANLDRKIKK